MTIKRRFRTHFGDAVLTAAFLAALLAGVGVNAFLSGQPALFGDYGYNEPGSPSVPLSVTATAGDETVTAEWAAPTDQGAGPITGYIVYLYSGGSLVDSVIVGPSARDFEFSGLSNGTSYDVIVSAINAAGEGPRSVPVSATPTGLPDAPTINTVVPGNKTLTVNWSAPTDTGGLPIIGYTIDVTEPVGAPAVANQTVGNVTSAVFTGLLNQQSYSFTVAAITANGTGPASAPVAGTPNGPVVPGAPLINAAVPGDGSVTVHFTPPASNGGAAIDSYTVTVTQPGSPPIVTTVTGPGSPITVTGLTNGVVHTVVVKAHNVEGFGPDSAPRQFTPNVPVVTPTPPSGYWMVGLDGGVFAFGNRGYYGSMAGQSLAAPVFGIASTPDGKGYWLVGADGGVFAFGNAKYFGNAVTDSAQPVTGLAATPDGGGYWLVATDGGVFAKGNAPFFGSAAGLSLNAPVIGIAAAQTGLGYYLVALDGGVFNFNAPFHGSVGGIQLNEPVVGMATLPGNTGYYLTALDGGLFALDAAFYGSMASAALAAPVIGIA